MKHILLINIYFFFSIFSLTAQETGVLYFSKVKGKYGWFETSNKIKSWKYEGEIKNGKPNGTGGFKIGGIGSVDVNF